MKFRVVLVLALFCASSAVSAKKYLPPTPVAQELPVEVTLSQQEIAIDTPDNSAITSQFGLIGALVGAAVSNAQAKTAEQRAGEIRNLLIDYRFNERFEAALRAKLASEGLTPAPQFTVRDTPWDAYSANRQAGLQQAAASGTPPVTGTLMTIEPRYALSYTLQNLYVRMNVSIIERTRKPNGKYKDKWQWFRSYSFNVPLNPQYGVKPETNILRWKAIGGVEMQRMLDIGVEQVVDMLVYDFSADGRAEAARKVGKEFGEFKGNKTFGRQLRAGDEWYWLRTGKGFLMTLSGTLPVDGKETTAPAQATSVSIPTDAADAAATEAAPAAESAPAASSGSQ